MRGRIVRSREASIRDGMVMLIAALYLTSNSLTFSLFWINIYVKRAAINNIYNRLLVFIS